MGKALAVGPFAATDFLDGEVMWGSTQLRVSFRVGLSGLSSGRPNMKSVHGLVTMISLPSNLTSMSTLKRIPQKEGADRSRRPCVSAAQFRAALSCPCICRLAVCLSVPLACTCRRHQRPRICQCHRYICTCGFLEVPDWRRRPGDEQGFFESSVTRDERTPITRAILPILGLPGVLSQRDRTSAAFYSETGTRSLGSQMPS